MNKRKGHTMPKGPTLVLKSAVTVLGLIVLAVCLFVLPQAIQSEMRGDFDYGPIFVGMYLSAIPFFFALYQSLKILGYIDRSKVFTSDSVQAVKYVKYCAFAITGLYAAGLPYVYYVADRDDAPGVFAIGLIIVGAAFIVATASAVLQQLLQNAVEIKAENDLTV